MTDPGEVQLSELAKKMLSTPAKKREDSKLGKPRESQQESRAECADEESRQLAGFFIKEEAW